MRRFAVLSNRPNWEQIIADENLVYDLDGPDDTDHYWNEGYVYAMKPLEIEDVRAQIEGLHTLCMDAIDYISTGVFGNLGLTPEYFALAKRSWEEHKAHAGRQMDFYGRFDVILDDTTGNVKLLEYNADTPTGIVEAAVSQMSHYLFHFDGDGRYLQYNRIGDAFIDRWYEILQNMPTDSEGYVDNVLYFACVHEETGEDEANLRLLQHTAQMAGWDTRFIYLEDVVYNADDNCFEDEEGRRITNIFKLYPWEDIALDEFGQAVINCFDMTHWFEPPWKMFLSTKVLLAALWKLHPGHPNLVPAYFGSPEDLTHYVQKPIFGREGDGVAIIRDGELTGGEPDETPAEKMVYQEYIPTPNQIDEDGVAWNPVIGAWVVGGHCVGFGIRETTGPVTDYYCKFTPLVVEQF
ncbi:glutathionylspermidine synthase family protein [Corynebacterium sp. 13CS0277]|uniref:glutathionylspermidine synthase family protein n=1 Tax=Corynebacterium sp. 13CS0277 TaxID=2071994 RepID=UPI000D03EE0C|nr:glutathionylspermidine synthase family protein [Corynebacterium sp. 13CS0277]PRQ11567.1 glutathionylspermidine synthase family protein [Corynebacterium sp. 13CS0277]